MHYAASVSLPLRPALVPIYLVRHLLSLVRVIFLWIAVRVGACLIHVRRHLDFCLCESPFLFSEGELAVQMLY